MQDESEWKSKDFDIIFTRDDLEMIVLDSSIAFREYRKCNSLLFNQDMKSLNQGLDFIVMKRIVLKRSSSIPEGSELSYFKFLNSP